MADRVDTNPRPAAARRNTRSAVRGLLLASLSVGMGCSFLVDPGDLRTDSTATDAGSDAGSDAEQDSGASCDPRVAPSRPSGADTTGEEVYTFALEGISLDFDDAWAEDSYDLDGLCTDSSTTGSCTSPLVLADGPRGEDNVFMAKLLSVMQEVWGDVEAYARSQQNQGVNLPILQIAGWDGVSENDPHVEVRLFVSGEWTRAVGGHTAPGRDGLDQFRAYENYFDGDLPALVDDNAYIVNGTLVGLLPEVPFLVDIREDAPPLQVLFREGFFTLDFGPDLRTIDRAIFAGRWSQNDIAKGLAVVAECAERTTTAIRSVAGQFADVASDADRDGLGTECDAISAAVTYGFGYSAVLLQETVAQPLDLDTYCDDAGAADAGALDGGV